MPIQMNLKKKDPRFDGDRPSWNVVISGPVELFSSKLERFLFLHGLNAMNDEGETSIWSSKPSIAAPPVYLAALLTEKYNVKLNTDLARKVKAATGPSSNVDSLDHFIGAAKNQKGGGNALRVEAGSKDFIANCDESNYERRQLLEGAGWMPLITQNRAITERFGSRPYRTRDPFIAGNLDPFMTPEARARLGIILARAMKNIHISKSQEAPEGFNIPSPEGLEYMDFQKGGIHQVVGTGLGAIIADDMGLGKAQPLNARILTPSGWTTMGQIRAGDFVIGSNGQPTRVTGVYPQGVKEIFRVTFSDGSSTECCDEHLWSVNTALRRRRGNPARVLQLSEIRKSLVDVAGNRQHFIPMVQAVTFPVQDLPLDPYLLGVLLGDGCIKNRYTHISSADSEIVDAVRAALPQGLSVKHIANYDYGIVSKHAGSPNAVRRALVDLELAGTGSDDKFIPTQYLLGSVEQRLAILQGLMDTDGYVAKDGTTQFTSNSLRLADGVADLVMSLGGCARRSVKESASGKPHHCVTISVPTDIVPFRIARKIARHRPRIKYRPARSIISVLAVGQKPAQCIAVAADDHLYVTDDFILTHNTIQGIGVLNGKPETKRALFFCQANMRLKWAREIEKWKINQDLTVGYAEGSKFPDTDIVVINYDIAARHIETIRGIKWDLIVTDEAHNLKNPEAKRTMSILGDLDSLDGLGPVPMSPNGQWVHLTGTPKPNRISEMWPLLTSSRPDIWGTGPEARQAFIDRYEPPFLIQREIPSKYKNGKPRTAIIPLPGKPQRELELQFRLRGSGSFIRRMKRDTDMPPKFRTPIEMPFRLSKEDNEVLKEAEADMREIHARITGRTIAAGNSVPAKEVIDVIAGLKPGSPHFSEIARVRRNLGVLKAPHAARFITEELKEDKELSEDQRRKTVVFAHHKDVIDILAKVAREDFPDGVIVYDGTSGSAEKRQSLVDQFQEDPNKRLFIMSLAGATGITLTAACRMRVVEPDWSASNMVQIEDRIWRIGQEESCDIGYLFVPNSMDVNVGLALHSKMETDERSINTMSLRGMKVTRPKKSANVTEEDAKNNMHFGGSKPGVKTSPRVDDMQPELPL